MSFNPAMGKTVLETVRFLPEGFNVVELGSQTLTFNIPDKEIADVPAFYREIGAGRYDAIDTDGRGTINANLNMVMEVAEGGYDLVTNNGTGEHVFNQAAIFETCHNLCRAGGVMIHVLPWINWQNHGFYNFNPILFTDLAYYNKYEILSLFGCDRDGENGFEVPFTEVKNPEPTDKNFFVVAVMRKKYDAPFVVPQQGKYDTRIDPTSLAGAFHWPDEIDLEPYPHFVTRLDEGLYEQLAAEFPTDLSSFSGWGGNEKGASNVLEQFSAKDSLFSPLLSPLWKAFVEYTTSKHFFQQVIKSFSPHVQGIHPISQLPLETGIRGLENAAFQLDSQLAINTPVITPTSVRGPHVDDPRELFAGLLYMPVPGDTAGGNLELLRWRGARNFVGREGMVKKAEARYEDTEVVKTVDYAPNTIVFFLNTADSLHAVTERSPTNEVRRYVNMIAEVDKPLFELG